MDNNKTTKNQNFDFAQMEDKIQEVQDVIERAVNSRDFRRMSKSISRVIDQGVRQYQRQTFTQGTSWENEPYRERKAETDKTVYSGSDFVKPVFTEKKEKYPNLYASLGGKETKNYFLMVLGGIMAGFMGAAFMAVLLIQTLVGSFQITTTVLMMTGLAAGLVMLYKGIRGHGRIRRFRKYRRVIGDRTYCQLEKLSKAVGKSLRFVKNDVQEMIDTGWFLEGSLDKEETCLITSRETYLQYEESRRIQEERSRQEAEREQARAGIPPKVQEVLDRGEEYIQKIHKSNDAIPGEEISAKIASMEEIVKRIFQRAQDHPEIIPDLKRMMDYYLPMTVKLLDAYEDMDSQPVQGETIRASKKEIEDTLDTLNTAFAKLLDSVFQDTAWDVSSDISVLHTILAQEGLKDSDFQTRNK